VPALERGGAVVAYEVHGGAGDVVLCAHNLLTSRRIFDRVAAELANRYRVVAVDLRGHGESRDAPRAFTTRELADDLVAVLDAVEAERATFVGVSLGACAAMEAALAHPARVARLALMGATARASRPSDAAGSFALGAAARVLGMRAGMVRKITPVLFGPSFHAEERALVAEWERRIGAMVGRDVAYATRAWSSRPSLVERVGAIRAPVLLLVGEDDSPCPPLHSEEIAALVAGARVVRVPRAGHTLPLERPEETAAELRAFMG